MSGRPIKRTLRRREVKKCTESAPATRASELALP